MKRTNYAILALVVVMFGYITIQERYSLSTGETADRTMHVLPGLVRARLASVEVVRGEERYRIEATGRDRDGDPTFRFTTPTHAPVDTDLLLSAISAAEWADPLRTLTNVDASARRRFGLDRPRVTVRLGVADRTLELRFGSAEARGSGVYAAVGDAVFVVTHELFRAFDQPAAHFRNKHFAGYEITDAQRITVHSALGDVDLRRESDAWHMASPLSGMASEGRANVVLAFMRTIQATRFVAESPGDLAQFGLAAPSLRITVAGPPGRPSASISVGGPCEDNPGELYARGETGAVVCVLESDIEPLVVDARAYLELRAVSTEASGVEGFDVHDGESTLSVREHDGAFRFSLGTQHGNADSEAVSEWLDALRATRATAAIALPSSFSPSATLTVHRSGGRADEVVRFMRMPDESLLARRNDDDVALSFRADLGARLEVTTTFVRDRALLRQDPSAIDEIVVERSGGREILRRGEDGALELVSPEIPTEVARATELMMRLAGLEAVRFVSDDAAAGFELDAPRIVVRFVVRGSDGGTTTHRLAIGAPMPDGQGGAYATMDDVGAVFELVGATVELVASPLVSLHLLSTESLFVDSLDIREGGRSARVTRHGAGFALNGGTSIDASAQLAIDALADLDATQALGLGPPAPEFGFSSPRGEIRVHRAPEAAAPREVMLIVGARLPVADGSDALVAVRRADVMATFAVPASRIEAMLSLASARH